MSSRFQYRNGQLSVENVDLNQIVKKTGTPVYVYSTQALLEPIQALKDGLRGLDTLICFAVKANSNIQILKTVSQAGLGADIVSGGELQRAQTAGVSSQKIVFSGVGKTRAEMVMALGLKKGIYSFNVESLEELETLNQVATEMGTRARVALRYNPDVDPKTHPHISTGIGKNKFGVNRSEVISVCRRLRSLPGIELRGLSVHIGSQLLSLKPLERAWSRLRDLVREVQPFLPEALEFVDLGGGLGIRYRDEAPPSISSYCALIKKLFGKDGLKILLEPGRQICGNAGVLVTQILYRKKGVGRDVLIVDAGMNDLMRPALYGSYHGIIPIREDHQHGKLKKTAVVGPVCESSDCFAENRRLSGSLAQGDLLAIQSAGAYGFSMANQYNSRPRPSEVLVKNRTFRTIRKRESFADLIRGEG